MRIKQAIIIIGLVGLGVIFTSSVFAQAVITISPALPGSLATTPSGASPGAFIKNFYSYALFIAGFLAFAAIVYGGIRYTLARGNPSQETEAKAWIWSALLGILLLAGAYLILFTINPNLVNLSLPSLGGGGIPVIQQTSVGTTPPSNGTIPTAGTPTTGNCASGQCQTLPNCTPAARTNCGGAAGLVSTLSCIDKSDQNFTVNEGYPPTVAHLSQGHNTGCSVDVHVSNCAQVAAVQAAATACGATSANEYTACGGKTFTSTTGGNVHINAVKGSGGC